VGEREKDPSAVMSVRPLRGRAAREGVEGSQSSRKGEEKTVILKGEKLDLLFAKPLFEERGRIFDPEIRAVKGKREERKDSGGQKEDGGNTL